MTHYRKPHVIFGAFQLVPDVFPSKVPPWFVAAWRKGTVQAVPNDTITFDVHTPEGVMRANEGDWIIRGIKGEIYPRKNEIFIATYEIVEDQYDP